MITQNQEGSMNCVKIKLRNMVCTFLIVNGKRKFSFFTNLIHSFYFTSRLKDEIKTVTAIV